MKEIIVASGNQGKIKEIKAMLEPLDIHVLSMKDVLGDDVDIEENGTTFEENAIIKAESIMKQVQRPVLADDSGLEVDYLNKEPGIYSARWMGHDTSYDIKNQAIIDKLAGLVNDHIAGENGFGYDPIFYFPPLKKTSAEMTMEEKNQHSHRAKALRDLYRYLEENK
ncbi:non-canonical purine NTP pyrophosphatase [uncultured Sharpea sp.]|uniref:non-canonical purine NTP pyrophosphatase n=1 Tax=uncultured Sharpea sp. TaxID=1112738 RepID=UPI00258724CC|nr:non-canonical purine NTP pyrophosphatase [uncultured Sharpea sp.]